MASLKKIGDRLGIAPKREKKGKKEKKKKGTETPSEAAEPANGAAEAPLPEGRKARVLFDYEPEQDDEIPLTPGDIITVYDQDESGWWTGEIGEDYGLFPGAFVEFIDGPHDENYDFLASTGDEEEQRALQQLSKPERTTSSASMGSGPPAASLQSAEIETLKSKLAASEEARANMQIQLDQLKAALAAATSPPSSPTSASSEELEQLRNKVRSQYDELEALRVEKARLEQTAVSDAAELNSLRKARAESAGQSSILRQNVLDAQVEASKARAERDAALEQVKQLQESRGSATAEADLRAQKAALERANAQLTQDLAQLKAKSAAAASVAAPAASSAGEPGGKSVSEQRLEAQVRDLKVALDREQTEKARLLEAMKSEARATVRVAAEKRPPPASPKPAHLVGSGSSGSVVARAAAVNSATATTTPPAERPHVPPRRSLVTQPVNPEQGAVGSSEADWKEKKLKPTGLLAQLP